jgi:hypothetical protein
MRIEHLRSGFPDSMAQAAASNQQKDHRITIYSIRHHRDKRNTMNGRQLLDVQMYAAAAQAGFGCPRGIWGAIIGIRWRGRTGRETLGS